MIDEFDEGSSNSLSTARFRCHDVDDGVYGKHAGDTENFLGLTEDGFSTKSRHTVVP